MGCLEEGVINADACFTRLGAPAAVVLGAGSVAFSLSKIRPV